MEKIWDYLLLLLNQFAGGRGGIENNLMRFGLAAVLWAALLLVAWSRRRQGEPAREKLLVWGFGLGLARELFMFTITSLQLMGVVKRQSAYFISAPLEQALAAAAVVVVAGSYLRYILDDSNLARRFLQGGLAVTVLCYLATFWWWASFVTVNPAGRFGQTWAAWPSRIASATFMAGAIFLLLKRKGWLRNVMLLALFFFFLDEFLMLINLAGGEVHTEIFCPISHAFHILAIPLLGYVYIHEQAIEREEAVEALRESEERFRGIIENSSAGYYFMDRDGRYQAVNKAWLQMHNYSDPEEVIGQHFSLTLPQAELDQVGREVEQLLGGEAIPPRESTHRCKDKSTGSHTSSSSPVIHGGKVVGVEGFLIDRSQRAAAERKAQRRNEEIAALNAIATTISQSLDLDRMLSSILSKVLAISNMDAGCIQLIDEQDGALSVVAQHGLGEATIPVEGCPAREVASSGKAVVTAMPPDAPWRHRLALSPDSPHLFVGVPIRSREQTLGVLGMVGKGSQRSDQELQLLKAVAHQVGIAIENARLAEEASRVKILQEIDRLRSELIANVSHELRTPLGLIKLSCTSLLATDVDFDTTIRHEFLRGIEEETLRLERIVDNLLDLSRYEDGHLRLDKRPASVARLVERAIRVMEPQSTQHQFVHQPAPDAMVAMMDPKRMDQVLRNLLNNAIKYSPDGGTIEIKAYEKADKLVLEVSDEGIGIPAEDLERVFERFYRVQHPVTQKVRGVGLGLAVCLSIVKGHNGRMWVESVLGQGSRFLVEIPLAPAPVGEAAHA